METQRQRMTELLVQTLNKMFVQRPQDRDLRRDLAQASRIHANILRLTNKQQAALEFYQQALAHLEELVPTDRRDKKSQDRLAETLRDQANSLEATGDLPGAIAALTRASEIVGTLLRQFPNSTEYAHTNASILLDRADGKFRISILQVEQFAVGVVVGERRLFYYGNVQQGVDARIHHVDDILPQFRKRVRSR